jgi:hypothetical protein
MIMTVGLLVASPAMAADQFDLVCKGREKASAIARWRPVEVRYRLDLSRKVYCRFDCTGLESIHSVDDARIDFAPPADAARGTTAVHYIERSDGRWTDFISGLGTREGVCEPAPFSGFPTPKF